MGPLSPPSVPGRWALVRDVRSLDGGFWGLVLEHYVPAVVAFLRGPMAWRLRACGYDDPGEAAADVVAIAAARYDVGKNDRFGAFVVQYARQAASHMYKVARTAAGEAGAGPDAGERAAQGWLAREAALHDRGSRPGGDRDPEEVEVVEGPEETLRRLLAGLRVVGEPAWPSAGPDLARALSVGSCGAARGDGSRALRLFAELLGMHDALEARLPFGAELRHGGMSLLSRAGHGAFTPAGSPHPRTGARQYAGPEEAPGRSGSFLLGGHGASGPAGLGALPTALSEARVLGLLRLCLVEVPRGCLMCGRTRRGPGHHRSAPSGAAWETDLASRVSGSTPVGLNAFVREAARARAR